ncbi:hypothetical protein K6U49_04490 [Vibrio alginolyticus]|uniref:hypothetical protein n=1 Tax=Vibrio alginolyticus TaxID=663 RepID=UPI001EEA0FE4|nr:hypothetical protein [Vibrio alginolyticus]MCG6307878.1 hypothetical protein [Vibrio alginolyticus]
MLKAILHGKAGRIEHDGQTSVRWASLFKAREDLLTSTVFERFAYLSEPIQFQLLEFCFNDKVAALAELFGAFITIDYWLRYTFEEKGYTSQVEPDLIIRFENANLIVEVKPPAGGDQYFTQWRREVGSFLQSEEGESLPLYFLAIGRIDDVFVLKWESKLVSEFDKLICVGAIKWQPIADWLVEKLADMSLPKTDKRIVSDMLKALALYGLNVSNFKWDKLRKQSFPVLSLSQPLLSDINQGVISGVPHKSVQSLINHNFNSVSLDALLVWPRYNNE